MLKKYNLLICFISFTLLCNVRCDYFTSIVGLEDLLVLESYWVDNFENYVKALEESNNSLRKCVTILFLVLLCFTKTFYFYFVKVYRNN